MPGATTGEHKSGKDYQQPTIVHKQSIKWWKLPKFREKIPLKMVAKFLV
jgi:hypothetical protein